MSENRLLQRFKKCKLFFCVIAYAFYLYIYIDGFMLQKENTSYFMALNNSFRNNCISITKDSDFCEKSKVDSARSKYYERTVIILIDAFRADFMPSILSNPQFNTSMSFIEALIKNKTAVPFINKVHSPTVTMPRIITFNTGDISNFMDTFTNLDATELRKDNLLHQAHMHNLKSVFYGDETWLKLFPNLFIRSEGTHSFFVSDYQEVDTNVTRHLDLEFSKKDWDIMILHYLGVDHIGHAFGPYSNFLPSKLKEMDEVIQLVYNNLKNKSETQSLIVICGDHGMTSGGNHGGITESELLTPLIFISTNPSDFQTKDNIKKIDQVDFAPTMSTLLSIPIPINSYGNIIPDALQFSGLTPQQILNAANVNFWQLILVHKSIFYAKSDIYIERLRNFVMNHSELYYNISKGSNFSYNNYEFILRLYMNLLSDMKQDLLACVTGYDEFQIIMALIAMWVSLLCAIISHLVDKENVFYNLYLNFKSSNDIKIRICTVLSIFGIFCLTDITNIFQTYAIFYGVIIIFYLSYWALRFLFEDLNMTYMEKSSFSLFAIHIISLFSSSYIEEEHQTWYFILSTILILYISKCIFSILNLCIKLNKKMVVKSNLWHILRFSRDFDNVVFLVFILILHRILRNWNQTGDKWKHLTDIFDWLKKEENSLYSSVLVAVSLMIIVFYLKAKQNTFTYYANCLGVFCIYVYKCHEKYLSGICKEINIDIVLFPWFLYSLTVLIIISSFFVTKKFEYQKRGRILIINIITAWILFTGLIGRTYNIPITTTILLQEFCLSKVLWKTHYTLRLNVSCYLIMAVCSFFYQGNSNSLSTIDIYSGYTGLLSYHPLLVGFLIFCNTYNNIVLWLVLMIYRMLSKFNSPVFPKIIHSFETFVIYRLFVLAVYCIVMFFMRYHLFIFSVFMPKLFCEICHTTLFIIFILILIGSNMLNDKFFN